MIKAIKFIVRLLCLIAAIYLAIKSISFFQRFFLLSFEDISGMFALISSYPIESILLSVGILLFCLSLLGMILLMQYQIWRYPLSIFIGYIVGAIIMRWFYLMQPFQESILQLNAPNWYFPFFIATLLLLRALIGVQYPKKNKKSDGMIRRLAIFSWLR